MIDYNKLDTKTNVIEKLVSFEDDIGGGLLIKHEQDIPQEFLDALHVSRVESLHLPTGELHKVASIPTAFIDEWMLEGFDIFDPSVTAEDIMKRLRLKNLQKFIATEKHI